MGLAYGTNYGLGLYADTSTTGNPQMFVERSGNVGIGTTDPGGKLTIYDTASGYPNPQLRLGYDATHDYTIGRDTSTGMLSFTGSHATQTGFKFYTPSTEIMTMLNNGNVGIGTTDPTGKLEVESTSENTPALNLKLTGYSGNNGLAFGNGNYGYVDYNSAGGMRMSVLSGYDIQFGENTNAVYGSSSFTPNMVIDGTNGNVGIGTTNPQNELNVEGGLNATTNSYFGENITVTGCINFGSGGFICSA